MNKIPAINGYEQDCFYARRHYKYLQKPGVTKRIKKGYRKRFRQKEKILTLCEFDKSYEGVYTEEVNTLTETRE